MNASVVDQNGYRAGEALGGFKDCACGLKPCDVPRPRERIVTERGAGLGELDFAAPDQDYASSGGDEARGHAETEASAPSRDQRGLAGEIERFVEAGVAHARQPSDKLGVSWCLYMMKYSRCPSRSGLLGSPAATRETSAANSRPV